MNIENSIPLSCIPNSSASDSCNCMSWRLANAVHSLNSASVLEYWQAFSVFDVDGDGTISTEELGNVMKSLGQKLTDEEVQTMIREIDTDGVFNQLISCYNSLCIHASATDS